MFVVSERSGSLTPVGVICLRLSSYVTTHSRGVSIIPVTYYKHFTPTE
jgi:hypothetical protein